MNRLTGALISATIAASIAGCATLSSSAGGEGTKVDEQLALAVETGYQAASAGLRLGVETHVIQGADKLANLRALNRKAFRAVCLTRVAYNAANHRDLTTNLMGACTEVVSAAEMAQAGTLLQAASEAIRLVAELQGNTAQKGVN